MDFIFTSSLILYSHSLETSYWRTRKYMFCPIKKHAVFSKTNPKSYGLVN